MILACGPTLDGLIRSFLLWVFGMAAIVVVVTVSGLSAVRLIDRRISAKRRRANVLGLCPNCGYDLRATPRPGTPLLRACPECGRGVTWGTQSFNSERRSS